MGDFSSPGLKRFGRIAAVTGWTGAAVGAFGGAGLAVMGIPNAFGYVVALGAFVVGGISGALTGVVLAIPLAIGASVAINVAKKSLGLGKKPPQPVYVPPAPAQPVTQSVKEGLQEMKSAAQEFNAEAAVELANDLTFHKLNLSLRRKPPAESKPEA
jgi:hypothetical protein